MKSSDSTNSVLHWDFYLVVHSFLFYFIFASGRQKEPQQIAFNVHTDSDTLHLFAVLLAGVSSSILPIKS